MGKGDNPKKFFTLDSGRVVMFIQTYGPLVSFLYNYGWFYAL